MSSFPESRKREAEQFGDFLLFGPMLANNPVPHSINMSRGGEKIVFENILRCLLFLFNIIIRILLPVQCILFIKRFFRYEKLD
jgi:hypothetical protein